MSSALTAIISIAAFCLLAISMDLPLMAVEFRTI
jgi:hypothetical protein